MIKKAEQAVIEKTFLPVLNAELNKYLSGINDRDVEGTQEKLSHLKTCIQDKIDSTVDIVFGGSVAKHTYVDGLSDIDSLVVINGSHLEDQTPKTALAYLASAIAERLGRTAEVSTGRMAVTVKYDDGQELQLLPAIRSNDGALHVPSSRTSDWSRINPQTFQSALTKHNAQLNAKLVPTIKLAKAVLGQMPEAQRLSGYHVESLAIAAFKNYDGPKIVAAMLPAFFERASQLVLSPIRDSTGQSVHVDEYMGSAQSTDRQIASHLLQRIARRMRNASAAGSVSQWKAIIGSEE